MNSGIDLLKKYFPDLSQKQLDQFGKLFPLYKEWNEKINVISRKDIDHLNERHVLHSLGIAKVVQFSKGTHVIDAGTGGGFPGIPLAIFFPEVKFHLVDSIGKKIKVVDEIVSSLHLSNVTAEKSRVEEVKGKFDFAVSRAVASLKEMHHWLAPLLNRSRKNSAQNGMFFLKGGDLTQEIKELNKPVHVFELKDYFEDEFFETKKVLRVNG